ncbi:spore coat U domain-containing protein [uncultured Ramlibacter sp.]|uniref:Csu type fimbrial protein n=1 Tax=uncultured Ramlibacter sp. TaxID=260755 RepID=UPI00261BA003|nr:spore coat U domain-containing protein [uncultured Ramlibacter sp.]
MPMKRLVVVLLLCGAQLPCWAQLNPLFSRKPRPPSQIDCPLRPAECQIHVQVFNFGRGTTADTGQEPAHAHSMISVTCTRAPLDGLDVDVNLELSALPASSAREMREQVSGEFLRYDLYLDPARTRVWGDGNNGTFAIVNALGLNDRNRVGSLAFPIYGTVPAGQYAVPPGQWRGAVLTRLVYNPVCH